MHTPTFVSLTTNYSGRAASSQPIRCHYGSGCVTKVFPNKSSSCCLNNYLYCYCVYVCLFYMSMHACTHAFIHTRTCARTHTHTHTHTHTQTFFVAMQFYGHITALMCDRVSLQPLVNCVLILWKTVIIYSMTASTYSVTVSIYSTRVYI